MQVVRIPKPVPSSAIRTATKLTTDDVVDVLAAVLAACQPENGKGREDGRRHDWRRSLHPLCALRALAMLPPCRAEMAKPRDGPHGGTLDLLRTLRAASGPGVVPHEARSRWRRAVRAGTDFHDLRIFQLSDWDGSSKEAAAFVLDQTLGEFVDSDDQGNGSPKSRRHCVYDDDGIEAQLSDKTAFWINFE